MITRQNWLDVRAYLDYQVAVRQNNPLTASSYWARLRHMLEWADDKPFPKISHINPTLPAYLDKVEKMSGGGRFTASHLTATLKTCRAFLIWAKREYPGRYRGLQDTWIDTLRPSKARSEQAELKTRELFTLEDVRSLVAVPAETLHQRRLRAGLALMFLSGMRIGAFMTLPIECVNLESLTIQQLPAKGVRTKNSKAAITSLLNIPDLLEVAREWNTFVRANLPPTFYWYAHLDAFGEKLALEMPKGNRADLKRSFGRALRVLCNSAGVAYHSPHKLRHGHAVYAIKRATTIEELKAISQNLMHSNMGITDGIYGVLVRDDVHDAIMRLSAKPTGAAKQAAAASQPAANGGADADEIALIARALIALRDKPELLAALTGSQPAAGV